MCRGSRGSTATAGSTSESTKFVPPNAGAVQAAKALALETFTGAVTVAADAAVATNPHSATVTIRARMTSPAADRASRRVGVAIVAHPGVQRDVVITGVEEAERVERSVA